MRERELELGFKELLDVWTTDIRCLLNLNNPENLFESQSLFVERYLGGPPG